MKILLLILTLLATNSFSANLIKTNEKTTKYTQEKDTKYIVYKKDKHMEMSKESYIQFSDANFGFVGLNKTTGLNFSDIKVYANDGEYSKKYTGQHTTGLLQGFRMGVGDKFFYKNKDRYFVMSTFNNFRFWDGVIINSKDATFGSYAYWTDKGIYFGDVINELSTGRNGTRRTYTKDTDNRNLFIQSLSNPEELNVTHNSSKTPLGKIVIPTSETLAFPSFGVNAQKIMRSEKIWIGAYNCEDDSVYDYYIPSRIVKNDNRQSNINRNCNLSMDKDRINSLPLYNRAASAVSNGEILNNGAYQQGTSFAAPKVGGYATLIQEKFPNMSWLQIKQVLLTTAYRIEDKLSNVVGWGIIDIEKALKGPSNFNAGLIEEQKFFTGFYDKIFDNKGNIYFYADVLKGDTWVFSNDINGNLTKTPIEETFNVVLNKELAPTNAENKLKGVIENLNFRAILPSEINYYESTSNYKPGLRKAGPGTLKTTGNLNYTGRTQVLEGTLEIKGNVPNSSVWVFSNANLVLNGNNTLNEVNVEGGNIHIKGNVYIKELTLAKGSKVKIYENANLKVDKYIGPKNTFDFFSDIANKITEVNSEWGIDDIVINEYKVMDLPREFYFSNFSSSIKNLEREEYSSDIYNKIKNRYQTFGESSEGIKKDIPGYSNGVFKTLNDPDRKSFEPEEYTHAYIGIPNASNELISRDNNWKFIPLEKAIEESKNKKDMY